MNGNDELIRLENITKRFGGVTALNNVSFSIGKGEVHAVVGENGAAIDPDEDITRSSTG
jgi:ABC-type sugar transport system ATPase subunit